MFTPSKICPGGVLRQSSLTNVGEKSSLLIAVSFRLDSITAGRLFPNGVFVRPRMDAYREESGRIMEIIAGTGAIVE